MKIIGVPLFFLYTQSEVQVESKQKRDDSDEEHRVEQTDTGIRAQLLIDLFKKGTKLTPDEMEYLRKNAKGEIRHIERIAQERELVEQRMKISASKLDWQNVVLYSLQQIAKHSDFEERGIRTMHIADAQYQYMGTEDYMHKPIRSHEQHGQQTNNRITNKSLLQHTSIAIVAYEQAKLLTGKNEEKLALNMNE